jgi:hypothetical protein
MVGQKSTFTFVLNFKGLQSFHYTVKGLNQYRPAQHCSQRYNFKNTHFSLTFLICIYSVYKTVLHIKGTEKAQALYWLGCQLDFPGFGSRRAKKYSHSEMSNLRWGPPSLLPNGHRSGVKLNAHLYVAARLRISSTITFTPPTCLQGLFSRILLVYFTYQTYCSTVDYTTHELTFL